MNIVDPSVEIVSKINYHDAISLISTAARTCYKSKHKTVDEEVDFIRSLIQKKKHESVLEHYSFSVRFIIDRGCCYSNDTEVLTNSGWKLFKDVNHNDLIACLNDNGYIEYHSYVKKYESYYSGLLLQFTNNYVDFLVTPNHKKWVKDFDIRTPAHWKFIESQDMYKKYNIETGYKWHGTTIKFVIQQHHSMPHKFPKIDLTLEQTNDFLELLGIWVADGCFVNGYRHGGGTCLQIVQKKQHVIDRIMEICERLNFRHYYQRNKNRIIFGDARHVNFIKSMFSDFELIKKSYSAFVPDIIKNASKEQISRFLNGVILGDGTVKPKKSVAIYTASKRFADDLHDLICKIGGSANIRVVKPRIRHWYINGKNYNSHCVQSYVVCAHLYKPSETTLDKRSTKSKHYKSTVQYNNMVYCLEVPYHRLYVRRNGKSGWSGNSHELVRHRICAFSQESTRYCNYNSESKGGINIIHPNDLTPEQYKRREKLYRMIESVYDAEISDGLLPQIARGVLPNALKTEIITTANIRQWRHMLKLRVAPNAHPQIREVMITLLMLLNEYMGVFFEDITIGGQ